MGAASGRFNGQLAKRFAQGDLDDLPLERRYRVVVALLRGVCKKAGGKLVLTKEDRETKPWNLLIDNGGDDELVLHLEGYTAPKVKKAVARA